MEKKKFYQWFGGLFLILTGALTVLFFVARDQTYSSAEQRSLTTLSSVQWKDIGSGAAQEDLEAYAADQFPFRTVFLSLRSRVAVLFGEREHNGVYYGKDDYLLERFCGMDEEKLQAQAAAVSAFAKQHASVSQYMIVCPTGSEIMKNKLPSHVETTEEETYVEKLKESFGGSLTYIDVSKTLRNHRDEYIYYRTDHRWTTLGAYYAYKAAEESMGLDAGLDNFEALPVSTAFQGDLRAKSGYGAQTYDSITVYFYQDTSFLQAVTYADTEEISASLYSRDALSTKMPMDVFFGGDHAQVQIETSAASNKHLLVLGDASAAAFIPFLTPQYSRVVWINPALFTEDIEELMREEDITDILYLYHASTLAEDASLAALLQPDAADK